MEILCLGLMVFFAVHGLHIYAPERREFWLQRWGQKKFRIVHSVLALVSLGLIVWGYVLARAEPVVLWQAPTWARHATFLLMWLTWVLWMSAFIHGNWFKVKLTHPMLLGVKSWAVAHLLVNVQLHQVVLFAAFLAWAVLAFATHKRRARAQLALLLEQGQNPPVPTPVSGAATQFALAMGTIAFILFLAWGHKALIGVSPLGM